MRGSGSARVFPILSISLDLDTVSDWYATEKSDEVSVLQFRQLSSH